VKKKSAYAGDRKSGDGHRYEEHQDPPALIYRVYLHDAQNSSVT
jgi:hypothetical protein